MMRQKGLDAQTVDDALGMYSSDDIASEITDILRKKYADKAARGR